MVNASSASAPESAVLSVSNDKSDGSSSLIGPNKKHRGNDGVATKAADSNLDRLMNIPIEENESEVLDNNVVEPVTPQNFKQDLLSLSKVNFKHNPTGTESFADVMYDGSQANIQIDSVPSSGVRSSKFGSLFMTCNVPKDLLNPIQHALFRQVYDRRTDFIQANQSSLIKRVKAMSYDTFLTLCKPVIDKHEYEGNVQFRVIGTVPSTKPSKMGEAVVDGARFSFMDPSYKECPVALNTRQHLREAVFAIDRVVYRRGEWTFKKTWGLAVSDEYPPTKIMTVGMKGKRKRFQIEPDSTAY